MNANTLRPFLSDSARRATSNDIRELLAVVSRPGMISLAGGLPSPDAFPIEELARDLPGLLRREGARALQYGRTEGDPDLRRMLPQLQDELEGQVSATRTADHVLVTSASQQSLDLCSRAFVSPGDAVICGLPSYLGALGAFRACGAELHGVPLDDEGLRTDLLGRLLLDLDARGVRPKLVYAIPDFQNPSGVTYSRRRRLLLLALAREYNLLVLEDCPYRQLRYCGEAQPSLGTLDRDGRVISLYSFSKILFPGLRLGWIAADPSIIAQLTLAKQPVDLCTSGLSQLVARAYLESGRLPGQIEHLRRIYSVKLEAILAALQRHMDPAWGVEWTRPQGGMFVWVTLPGSLDARRLLDRTLKTNMAFVAGQSFHCDGSGSNTLRLNFSFPDVEQIDTAVERLARCIGSMLRDPAPTTADRGERTLH